MARLEEAPSRLARFAGPLLTLIVIAVTEIFTHAIPLGELPSAGLFLLAYVPIAYSALQGGLPLGLLSTALLTLYTFRYVAQPGEIVELRPIVWPSLAIVSGLGVAMTWPMSRIKRREDRLREALESRAQDLQARNADLTSANEALEAFGYVVSHDLKEPVRALENYLDAARQEWPSDESRGFVEQAYRANERLARLLHGLLDYSRLSSGATTTRAVDIEAVLTSDACRAQYEKLLHETDAQLRIEPGLPRVQGDDAMLAQLFGNVLLNALRHHGRAGARVVVGSAEAADGFAHVTVCDDGPGFPPDVLARFGELRGNRPATIKSGFGLVIAHRAAQRLGGRMWIENPPGGGARVHVELPAAPGGAAATAAHLSHTA
ncbi:MAG TPA: HAMP domain-containing sensor histidine kinase [Candidatus Thermoplasmatota archaeon]|nr:HAMP domain-containing sensor histidine kinase [Candidatus Thermoplasmatota archaeon]